MQERRDRGRQRVAEGEVGAHPDDREQVEEPQAYGFAEIASLPMNPGGFRPDLDYDAEVWALPLPEYDSTRQ